MATFEAIAAVTRSLRRLLRDRMASANVAVTSAPLDVSPAGVNGPRINIYLFHIIENSSLRNQSPPGREHPAVYGQPPLSLNLRYILTSHSQSEDQADSDVLAQSFLGDAMLALHDFGGRLEELSLVTNRVGAIGDRLIDPVLQDEFERVKVTLEPAGLEEIAKLWAAIPEANFRRSAVYVANVVQMEGRRPRRAAPPVAMRRLLASVSRPPSISATYRTPPPPPADQLRDLRIGIGEELTIEHPPMQALRLYVRFGELDPIRMPLPSNGRIRLNVPDAALPIDEDNAAPRPIAAEALLQPGALEIVLLSVVEAEGLEGALDRGLPVMLERALRSNVGLMQLTPTVVASAPSSGDSGAILRVTGQRLWTPDLPSAIAVGDALIPVRQPGAGDAFAAPSPTQVEIPVSAIAAVLHPSATPYRLAAVVNGVRSRETAHSFRLDP